MKKLLAVIIICLALILGLLYFVKFKNSRIFRVIFFNVGQGDSALIQFENGLKMLVDCGPNAKILAKLGAYLPFYDKTIDYLLVTHFDSDHYGGCLEVLKRYKVKNIITNGDEKSRDEYWLAWRRLALAENASEIVVDRVDSWLIASSTIEFLFPDAHSRLADSKNDIRLESDNNRSIVFRLVNPRATILFTGDIEEEAENLIIDQYCAAASSSVNRIECPKLRSKILKVAHHGSDSSTGVKFLQAIQPEKAVISVGFNHFGHPSLRVLQKIQRVGAEIIRTDQAGDTEIK